jgi:hypothetical protein
MLPQTLDHFQEIWCVDYEFSAKPGERPEPLCLVAHEYKNGRTLRQWQDQFGPEPPYNIGKDALFVSYYAPAEFSCHLARGWKLPVYTLDLYTEFRNITNGHRLPCGRGLLGALAWFGLASIGASEKAEMRELALRGGEYSEDEMEALLDYCHGDVDALVRLLPKMLPHISLPHALIRGRYMKAVARMEHHGIPIDTVTLERLRSQWIDIKDRLITQVDADYGVFDGQTFKADRWLSWCQQVNIPWPLLESGAPTLDKETFKTLALRYPRVEPIRQLRKTLSELRLNDLTVGEDGRNRCLLSPYGSKTSRNTPSTSKYVFGPSAWLRGLIKPPEGHSVAYIDWVQQEIGIAAALSGDSAMIEAYASGDVYTTFAKQAGAVPDDATKQSHLRERALFKMCMLAVGYGQGSASLAAAIGRPEEAARQLLRLHHETYKRFWQWSDAIENHALLTGQLHTTFDWRLHIVDERPNCRSIRNWPMQSNGAEMLRLACCLGTDLDIKIIAPVHDAVLIEAPTDEIGDAVCLMQSCMALASRMVLSGFELRTSAEVTDYPDRFEDEKGFAMWAQVQDLLQN